MFNRFRTTDYRLVELKDRSIRNCETQMEEKKKRGKAYKVYETWGEAKMAEHHGNSLLL